MKDWLLFFDKAMSGKMPQAYLSGILMAALRWEARTSPSRCDASDSFQTKVFVSGLKIADDVEFLGGCATGLLVADSAAPLYPVARRNGGIDLSPRGFMGCRRQRPARACL